MAPDALRPCVSIVVPCRNEAERIVALLGAVRSQTIHADELIVVDGGSVDRTQDVLEQYRKSDPPTALTILSIPSRGIPTSLNTGIRDATGDVIVRLDAHCVPELDYVANALEALEATGAGVVGGRWTIRPGRTCLVAEGIAVAVAHPMGAGDAAYRLERVHAERIETDTVPFGCFRKALWERVGGFNEELLANEDYEFNYRVRQMGLAVVLDPAIRSVYVARPTLAALAQQYFRYGWWKAQMLKRYPESLRWRQAVPGVFTALLVVLVLTAMAWPGARLWLGSFLAAYLTVLLSAALHAVWKGGRRHILAVTAAFATIHLSWGSGLLTNLLTFGRWPTWRQPTDQSDSIG